MLTSTYTTYIINLFQIYIYILIWYHEGGKDRVEWGEAQKLIKYYVASLPW